MQSILLMFWLLINCNAIPYVQIKLVQTISTLIHSTRLLSFYYNSSFLTLSIYVTPTKLLNHLISCTFASLLSALFIPLVFRTMPLVKYLHHTGTTSHLYKVLCYSTHSSVFYLLYTPHAFLYHVNFYVIQLLPVVPGVL